jgi:hypothetical protein
MRLSLQSEKPRVKQKAQADRLLGYTFGEWHGSKDQAEAMRAPLDQQLNETCSLIYAQRGYLLLGCAGNRCAPGRDRTCTLRFRRPLLYPLSYGS